MKHNLRYFVPPLIIFLIVICVTLAINSALRTGMSEIPVILLALSFTISTILSLIVFIRGLSREPDVQALHTFVATGVKFLIELFIALMWFVAAKKTSQEYILLFFVLYLAFSMFFIKIILKALKKKSL